MNKHRSGDRCGNAYVITLVVIVILVVAGLAAWTMKDSVGRSSVSGWHKDVDEGWAAAETHRKPVIMLFTADWCPPCRKLKREVLSDPEVVAFLDQDFVLIKVDLTDRRGPNNAIADDYDVRTIPTLMAFDSLGDYVDTYNGHRTKNDFMAWASRSR